MKTDSSFAVQGVGLLRCVSRAQMDKLPIALDVCAEALSPLAYALKSACVIAALLLVAVIVSASSSPQILPAIIQCVVVAMIAFNSISLFKSKQLPMHGYECSLPVNVDGTISVEALPALIPMRIPSPLVKPFVICRVNLGKLTLRQRDDAILGWGWHGRLLRGLKCMSVDALTTPLDSGGAA